MFWTWMFPFGALAILMFAFSLLGLVGRGRTLVVDEQDVQTWQMYRRWWQEEQAKNRELQAENEQLRQQLKEGPYR